MKNLFHDILDMDGVHGILLLSESGKVLFESFDIGQFSPQRSTMSLKTILDSLGDFREMSLILENGRCYLRQTENGYLIISMAGMVSTALKEVQNRRIQIIFPPLRDFPIPHR